MLRRLFGTSWRMAVLASGISLRCGGCCRALSVANPSFVYTLDNNSKNTNTNNNNSKSRTLYIPLTSLSNSRTLPETRGPNFGLPSLVVAVLCRVRDAEQEQQKWKHWCTWLDQQDSMPQKLPPPDPSSFVWESENQTFLSSDNYTNSADDELLNKRMGRPTVDELMIEVLACMNEEKSTINSSRWTMVIAGEGEPTLRFEALLELVRRLRNEALSTLVSESTLSSISSIRILTNGLLLTDTTRQLLDCCKELQNGPPVTLSVALMTHDAHQYDQLMQRRNDDTAEQHENDNDARLLHDRVVAFVQSAVAAGVHVEITAVDRPDVDKNATNNLSLQLGVDQPVRWRSYFP